MTLLIMVVLPPDRTIDNLGEFLFHISPVVFAVAAVAGFPPRPALGLVLLAVLVIVYMGVLDTLNIMRVLDFSKAVDQDAAFPKLYQFTTFIDAFTVIAVLFGYRLGGAATNRVLRLGGAATLVLISGLNDLTFFYLYGWPEGRPARLDWASHIRVFIGHDPTPTDAIIFCAVHLLLAALILAWPALRRRRVAEAGPVAPAEEALTEVS
jgi:hypothetical protein